MKSINLPKLFKFDGNIWSLYAEIQAFKSYLSKRAQNEAILKGRVIGYLGAGKTGQDVINAGQRLLEHINGIQTTLGGTIDVAIIQDFDTSGETAGVLSQIRKPNITIAPEQMLAIGFEGFKQQIMNYITDINKSQIRLKNEQIYIDHFQNYLNQIVFYKLSSPEERQMIYKLAWRMIPHNSEKQRKRWKDPTDLTLSKFLYGNTPMPSVKGRFHEPYLLHVLDEHKTDYDELKNNLNMTKQFVWNDNFNIWDHKILFQIFSTYSNNTYGGFGGDIIIVDGNGNVQYNIQSKVSASLTLEYKKNYMSLIRRINAMLVTLKTAFDKGQNNLTNDQALKIFNYFKASTYVLTNDLVNNTIRQSFNNNIIK